MTVSWGWMPIRKVICSGSILRWKIWRKMLTIELIFVIFKKQKLSIYEVWSPMFYQLKITNIEGKGGNRRDKIYSMQREYLKYRPSFCKYKKSKRSNKYILPYLLLFLHKTREILSRLPIVLLILWQNLHHFWVPSYKETKGEI